MAEKSAFVGGVPNGHVGPLLQTNRVLLMSGLQRFYTYVAAEIIDII